MLAPLLLLQTPSLLPFSERVSGVMLWIACGAPMVVYVFRSPQRREAFPFFPLIGLVFGAYYALPAMSGAVNLAYRPDQFRISYLDPAHDFKQPIELALWGWLLLLAGYATLSLFFRPKVIRQQAWPAQQLALVLVRILILGSLAEVLHVTGSIPGPLKGAIAFVAILNRFAIATLVAMRVRGKLAIRERTILLIAIPIEILLLLAEGSIAKVMLFVLLLGLAHWVGGGRLRARWVALGLIATLGLVVLKGVLYQYRRQAWFAGVQLNPIESAGLMAKLVTEQVKSEGIAGAVGTGWEVAVARSATLDLFADAVRRTPRDIPYWGGTTYLSLVGVAIPRVLWPTKPTKTLGQDFGHRYAYIEPSDVATSVNLPFLVEFYINFGPLGVFVGMLITGMIYRLLDVTLNRPSQNIVRTIANMSILIPLLNVESDFSLVFGGIFLNAIALLIVLRYMRRDAVARAPKVAAASTGTFRESTAPLEGD